MNPTPPTTERDFAYSVVQRLQQAGHIALWAGGCVRDQILGLVPADYDIATSARPDEVQQLFRRTHNVGASFGVVEVLGPRSGNGEWLKTQVATFRTDGNYTDGRRPDSVVFSSPEEDAKRRDFTMNALFLDPVCGDFFDYVNGRADLANNVVRAVGEPRLRFQEDKLRILRAVRMAARFDFTLEEDTAIAIKAMAGEITVVSVERIAEEFRKIITHPNRVRGLSMMAELGLMQVLFPEITEMTSTLERFARLPQHCSFCACFATFVLDLSLRELHKMARWLKFSLADEARIAWLVEHASKVPALLWLPNSESYPILAHAGIHELLVVGATTAANDDSLANIKRTQDLITTTEQHIFDPPALLTGDDLRKAGYKPGPRFKSILEAVRAQQLNGEVTTLAQALTAARQLWEAASP